MTHQEFSKKPVVLIVDDSPANIGILFDTLDREGHRVLVSRDGESALKQVKINPPDIILLDIMMPGIDGFETCRRLKEDKETRDIPVIFMTALDQPGDKLKGFSAGAVDYITKPFNTDEVLARVKTHVTIKTLREELEDTNELLEEKVNERTSELKAALTELEELKDKLSDENEYLRREIKLSHNFEEIIGSSKPLKQLLAKVEQVADTDATVMILGETGTGKELIARAIHNLSERRDRPLVKINCAAIPPNLLESELFGHEKGAFTGAFQRKIGRFELANHGTLFLDEIADLPMELQPKLLRVLQEGEFERLGDTNTIKTDVRLITATNKDLEKSLQNGSLREDLYYRLNVFPLEIPSLRERKDDIPALVKHFVEKYGRKTGRKISKIPQGVINRLEKYNWPGNVRELENIIERAVILSKNDTLEVAEAFKFGNGTTQLHSNEMRSLQEVEKSHILNILKHTSWVIEGKNGASKVLGLKPSTLRTRMQKLGIKRPKGITTNV